MIPAQNVLMSFCSGESYYNLFTCRSPQRKPYLYAFNFKNKKKNVYDFQSCIDDFELIDSRSIYNIFVFLLVKFHCMRYFIILHVNNNSNPNKVSLYISPRKLATLPIITRVNSHRRSEMFL